MREGRVSLGWVWRCGDSGHCSVCVCERDMRERYETTL